MEYFLSVRIERSLWPSKSENIIEKFILKYQNHFYFLIYSTEI